MVEFRARDDAGEGLVFKKKKVSNGRIRIRRSQILRVSNKVMEMETRMMKEERVTSRETLQKGRKITRKKRMVR